MLTPLLSLNTLMRLHRTIAMQNTASFVQPPFFFFFLEPIYILEYKPKAKPGRN
jgi:hypothetical protein